MPREFIEGVDHENDYGIRFHHLHVPLRGDPIILRIFHEMNRRKVPISYVSEKSGVGKWTIGAWRRGQSPTLQNLRAVCEVLDLKLDLK